MFEQITVTDADVKSLDPEISGNSFKKAVITIEDADLRWRTDGTNPTTSIGLLGAAGGVIVLNGNSAIKNFRCICRSGTAVLNVQYQ